MKKQLKKFSLGKHTFDLQQRSLLMGILNVTPDSFSDGGKFAQVDIALQHALQMVKDGADIIDIGGESTRPGSQAISTEEEINRVVPVILAIRRETDIPISIDTWKSEVFLAAAEAGADMLNDVSGLTRDPKMLDTLKKSPLPVTIMHSSGTPETMQQDPYYEDLLAEIMDFLSTQAKLANHAGVETVIIDPGIGFGKTVHHNLQLIQQLERFTELELPILLGPSRKSYIGNSMGLDVEQRLEPTLASAAIGIINGANIMRLHDVKEGRKAIDMAHLIKHA